MLMSSVRSVRGRHEDYHYYNYHTAAGGGQSSLITVCDVLCSLLSGPGGVRHVRPSILLSSSNYSHFTLHNWLDMLEATTGYI